MRQHMLAIISILFFLPMVLLFQGCTEACGDFENKPGSEKNPMELQIGVEVKDNIDNMECDQAGIEGNKIANPKRYYTFTTLPVGGVYTLEISLSDFSLWLVPNDDFKNFSMYGVSLTQGNIGPLLEPNTKYYLWLSQGKGSFRMKVDKGLGEGTPNNPFLLTLDEIFDGSVVGDSESYYALGESAVGHMVTLDGDPVQINGSNGEKITHASGVPFYLPPVAGSPSVFSTSARQDSFYTLQATEGVMLPYTGGDGLAELTAPPKAVLSEYPAAVDTTIDVDVPVDADVKAMYVGISYDDAGTTKGVGGSGYFTITPGEQVKRVTLTMNLAPSLRSDYYITVFVCSDASKNCDFGNSSVVYYDANGDAPSTYRKSINPVGGGVSVDTSVPISYITLK